MDKISAFGMFWLVVVMVALPVITSIWYSKKSAAKKKLLEGYFDSIEKTLESIHGLERTLREDYSITTTNRLLTNKLQTSIDHFKKTGKNDGRCQYILDKADAYLEKLTDKKKKAEETMRLKAYNARNPDRAKHFSTTRKITDGHGTMVHLEETAKTLTELTLRLHHRHNVIILWDNSGHVNLYHNYMYRLRTNVPTDISVNEFIEKLHVFIEVIEDALTRKQGKPNDIIKYIIDNLQPNLGHELTMIDAVNEQLYPKQRKWENPRTTKSNLQNVDELDIMLLNNIAHNIGGIELRGNESKDSVLAQPSNASRNVYEGSGGSFGGGGASGSWSSPSSSSSSSGSSSSSDSGSCSGSSDSGGSSSCD